MKGETLHSRRSFLTTAGGLAALGLVGDVRSSAAQEAEPRLSIPWTLEDAEKAVNTAQDLSPFVPPTVDPEAWRSLNRPVQVGVLKTLIEDARLRPHKYQIGKIETVEPKDNSKAILQHPALQPPKPKPHQGIELFTEDIDPARSTPEDKLRGRPTTAIDEPTWLNLTPDQRNLLRAHYAELYADGKVTKDGDMIIPHYAEQAGDPLGYLFGPPVLQGAIWLAEYLAKCIAGVAYGSSVGAHNASSADLQDIRTKLAAARLNLQGTVTLLRTVGGLAHAGTLIWRCWHAVLETESDVRRIFQGLSSQRSLARLACNLAGTGGAIGIVFGRYWYFDPIRPGNSAQQAIGSLDKAIEDIDRRIAAKSDPASGTP